MYCLGCLKLWFFCIDIQVSRIINLEVISSLLGGCSLLWFCCLTWVLNNMEAMGLLSQVSTVAVEGCSVRPLEVTKNADILEGRLKGTVGKN